MEYRYYKRALLFRILLVVLVVFFCGYGIAAKLNPFLIVSSGSLAVILIWHLIQFMNKTNEKVTYFIQAIKNDDTALRFPVRTGSKILDELHFSLNELNEILQQTKIKSQIKERYFREILQNIGTGVIVFNNDGFINEVNQAALDLFGLKILTHVAQFDRIDSGFRSQLENLKGGQKQMLRLKSGSTETQLASRSTVIQLKDEEVMLLTIQDIRTEIERTEIDSWIKLIRVMSHEIMNSLAPISSIAQSLTDLWKDKGDEITKEEIESTINGLGVIGERGEALKQFVQSYRVFTHVPQPQKRNVEIDSLIESLNILISPFKEHVQFQLHVPEQGYTVFVDDHLLIQVVINLVKNAAEAVDGMPNAKIDLTIRKPENANLKVEVSNNGPQIPDDVVDQIFVPFFTTKERGTGVGLSHSRQIARAMGGTINCETEPDRTSFIIQL